MQEQILSRAQKIEWYDKLIATIAGAARKGDTIPYTSLNGHMYSMFTKENFVALRLPEHERKEFLQAYNTKLVEQYGIVQKEYVVVPESLLQNIPMLKVYFEISYDYVSRMKPKSASKSKK